MPHVLTSTHPLPQYVLVPPWGKSNSLPLHALSHSHNYPQPPPKATSSQPSHTPSSDLVQSMIPTAPSSLPSSLPLCLDLRKRPSSQAGANVLVPNYGASLSGHNIILKPPLAPPWIQSNPSAPMIYQALRHSYVTYTPTLDSPSDPPG